MLNTILLMCLGHLTCTLPQGNTSVQSCPPYISIMPFMGRGVWYMYVERLESGVPSDWSRHDTVIWHSSVLIGWRLGLMSHKTAILVNIPTVIIFSNSLAQVLFCLFLISRPKIIWKWSSTWYMYCSVTELSFC